MPDWKQSARTFHCLRSRSHRIFRFIAHKSLYKPPKHNLKLLSVPWTLQNALKTRTEVKKTRKPWAVDRDMMPYVLPELTALPCTGQQKPGGLSTKMKQITKFFSLKETYWNTWRIHRVFCKLNVNGTNTNSTITFCWLCAELPNLLRFWICVYLYISQHWKLKLNKFTNQYLNFCMPCLQVN